MKCTVTLRIDLEADTAEELGEKMAKIVKIVANDDPEVLKKLLAQIEKEELRLCALD